MANLRLMFEGAFCSVYMLESVCDEYGEVDAKRRARVEKWMRTYAEEGPAILDSEKYNSEGRHPTGRRAAPNQINVYAFKAWQLRLYGGTVGGKFVVVEIDSAKKRDRANQARLQRAAKKLGDML